MRPLNSVVRLHMKKSWLAVAATYMACNVAAREAPAEMTTFNQVCPAPELLPRLEAEYQSCLREQRAGCDAFVDTYRKLLPEYDCQRSFDATPRVNYIVPAIWLSRDHEKYVALLSKLKSKSARGLFASPEFRRTLDGYVAEMYLEKSEALERELRRK